MLTVNAIKCPNCKAVIFSRAWHDQRYCSCGRNFIDGGFEYVRYGGADYADLKIIQITVDATKKELWDDWNEYHDKFGLIPEGE